MKAQSAWLRERLSESRQANEKLYIELKRYKNIVHARSPWPVKQLMDDNTDLRSLVMEAMLQLRELCSITREHCHDCPLHHGDAECRMVILTNDARKHGIEVAE